MAKTSSKFEFPLNVSQIYSNALWDPTPTTSQLSEKQLAYALGYPSEWRVERKVISTEDGKKVIIDRIQLTTNKKHFTWLNHDAAQAAALRAAEDGNIEGSHLMPPVPLFAKGNEIQVQYESKWYNGVILKRKKKEDRFLYTVLYTDDNATQSDVSEDDIRPRDDPGDLAVELGFPSDWMATRKGARYEHFLAICAVINLLSDSFIFLESGRYTSDSTQPTHYVSSNRFLGTFLQLLQGRRFRRKRLQ